MKPRAIIALRRRHGLSQEALARLIDVSFATVNRWEHGKGHPAGLHGQALQAIARSKRRPRSIMIEIVA